MYRFPSNPELRKFWLDALLVKNRQESGSELPKYPRICILHFADECIEKFGFSHVNLKPNSVPSIFPNAPREESMDITSVGNETYDTSRTDISIKSEGEGSIGSTNQSDEQFGEFGNENVDPVQEFNEQRMSDVIAWRDFEEPTNHAIKVTPEKRLQFPAQVTENSIKSMSPRTLSKACMILKKAYVCKNTVVKRLQKQKQRDIKKIKSLQALLLQLKQKNLLLENTPDIIEVNGRLQQ